LFYNLIEDPLGVWIYKQNNIEMKPA